jgi:pyruvate/2-oxoglutarate dehydrogenase complex dihydrolipoamide acyltransferase (E2) component
MMQRATSGSSTARRCGAMGWATREQGGKYVVEVRPMCYVTLTIDHRVLDGYQANTFLTRWVAEIEGWR